MISIPAVSERALAVTIEGVCSEEITLTGPDGVRQTLRGQVVRESSSVAEDSRGISQGGRQSLVVTKSSVTLRKTSLNPVPDSEELWMCAIPVAPEVGAAVQTMFVETVPQGSKTIGLVILRLTSTKEAPIP